VNHPRFNFFQAVRFLANVFDLVDANVSALQQPDRLLAARFAVGVSAF
jgi:hypothetical protein